MDHIVDRVTERFEEPCAVQILSAEEEAEMENDMRMATGNFGTERMDGMESADQEWFTRRILTKVGNFKRKRKFLVRNLNFGGKRKSGEIKIIFCYKSKF